MWKILEAGDLGEIAREKWMSEKPLACPGIAIGNFDSGNMRSYAVLLVHQNHEDTGYKLLVFGHETGQLSYAMKIVEQSPNSAAGSFFIHAAPIRKVLDEPSRKKSQTRARDGILFIDAAEKQNPTNLYFAASGSYQRQTINH